MKKKLTLNEVLSIKTCVEKLIQSSYDDLIKYNDSDTNAKSLLQRIEKLEAQLVHLKEVIQTANQALYGKVSNNTRIYTLSNLATKKRFYETIAKTTSKKKLQISKTMAKVVLTSIGSKMKEIEEQLTAFNNKKKVTVILDPDLELCTASSNHRLIRRFFQKK